jgi:hypothetical protein
VTTQQATEALVRNLRRRIDVAWHVLRGHAVAYRVNFIGPVTVDGTQRKLWVIDCTGTQRGHHGVGGAP